MADPSLFDPAAYGAALQQLDNLRQAQAQRAATMQTVFGGGPFGSGGGSEVDPAVMKAMLQLNQPNLASERAAGQAAALRGKEPVMQHAAKYGERGGGALAIGDAVAAFMQRRRQKQAEDTLASVQDNLAKLRTKYGGDALDSMMKRQGLDPNTGQTQMAGGGGPAPSYPTSNQGNAQGTPLTQPPSDESAGLRTGLSPEQLLKAYQAMQPLRQGGAAAGLDTGLGGLDLSGGGGG